MSGAGEGDWPVLTAVVYEFDQGGRRRQVLYETVRDALYSAVIDVHKERATPIAIRLGDKLLADSARIHRAYLACHDDLTAEPFKVPRALQALAARG